MKKLLAILLLTSICSFAAIKTQAQGGGGNFDPAQMKARQLEQLKQSDLKLTDAQADSVVSINMETRQQMMGMRDLSPEERQAKMKEINDYKLKRWTSALGDTALAQKVADFYEKQRQQRMQQGGGWGRPNN